MEAVWFIHCVPLSKPRVGSKAIRDARAYFAMVAEPLAVGLFALIQPHVATRAPVPASKR